MNNNQDYPRCFLCKRYGHEIQEYRDSTEFEFDLEPTPENITNTVKMDEGTYNPETNTFCCTICYIKIGMPTKPWPGRWVAPECQE